MSQVSIIDIEGNHPQIPTEFLADQGSAIPIANILEILGSPVAAGVLPVYTTGAANIITVNVQRAQAIAAPNALNVGLAAFDSEDFSVDATGFVSLLGGGQTIDSINVDTHTFPGTNPVTPNISGEITVTGGQVAAEEIGTNVIRTNSLAENTYTIEIQRSTTNATPNIIKNGVSHFSSSHFSVDSNGFVTASGTGIGQTITGDSGGALAPTAGNWDIVGGHDINTAGAGSTLTVHLDNAITLGDLAVIGAGSNALDCDTGDINLDSGNIKLPDANAALDQGLLRWTDGTRIHNFGSDNIFHGIAAGNGTLSGANNVAIGQNVLSVLTSGGSNVGIGTNCLRNISSASQNIGMGIATLTTLTTSTANTCIGHNSGNLISTGLGRNCALGYQTINQITTGSDNTALGYLAGFSYTGTETNNICIGAGTVGTLGESNVTRIGNAQTACYIDGIDGVNVGSTTTVVTEVSDRLGTAVITAGSGITITPAANTITIATTDTSTDFIDEFANLGMTYTVGTGTFTIHASDGTSLSADNRAYVRLQSKASPGRTVLYTITANQDFIDDNGASEIIGNLFGWTTGVAITVDVPFFIYAVSNDAENDIQFMLGRYPHQQLSSSTIGTPASASADAEGDMWAFDSITTSEYDQNPCVCIGSIRMRMSASDDWTVQTLSNTDGIGQYQNTISFTIPLGQLGANSGTVTVANGGTAPVFSTTTSSYYIYKDGSFDLRIFLSGDGGTDGSGAVNATVISPLEFSLNSTVATRGPAQSSFAGGNLEICQATSIASNANYIQIYRHSTAALLQWAQFTNGNRSLILQIRGHLIGS